MVNLEKDKDVRSLISKLQADLDSRAASLAELQGTIKLLLEKTQDSTDTSTPDDKTSDGGIKLETEDARTFTHQDSTSEELDNRGYLAQNVGSTSTRTDADHFPTSQTLEIGGMTSRRFIAAASDNIHGGENDDDTPGRPLWTMSTLKAGPSSSSASNSRIDALYLHKAAGKKAVKPPVPHYWVDSKLKEPIVEDSDHEDKDSGSDQDLLMTEIMINGVPRSIPSSLRNSASSMNQPMPPMPPPLKNFSPFGTHHQHHHQKSFGRKFRASAPAKLSKGWQETTFTEAPSLGPSRFPPPFERRTPRTGMQGERRGHEPTGLRKLRVRECAICGDNSHFAKTCPYKNSKSAKLEKPAASPERRENNRRFNRDRQNLESRPSMSRINEKAPGYPVDRQLELVDTILKRLGMTEDDSQDKGAVNRLF